MATVTQVLFPENAAFLSSSFPAFARNLGTNFPVTGLAYDAAAQEMARWLGNFASGKQRPGLHLAMPFYKWYSFVIKLTL